MTHLACSSWSLTLRKINCLGGPAVVFAKRIPSASGSDKCILTAFLPLSNIKQWSCQTHQRPCFDPAATYPNLAYRGIDFNIGSFQRMVYAFRARNHDSIECHNKIRNHFCICQDCVLVLRHMYFSELIGMASRSFSVAEMCSRIYMAFMMAIFHNSINQCP